mmetsp:Transcript_134967/g.269350  ORF Transcript_134967/g.269350 Transcript_134967/m.269350 type:complete len:111 (+) Transcript_134967:748-1080(+)
MNRNTEQLDHSDDSTVSATQNLLARQLTSTMTCLRRQTGSETIKCLQFLPYSSVLPNLVAHSAHTCMFLLERDGGDVQKEKNDRESGIVALMDAMHKKQLPSVSACPTKL